MKVNNTIDRVAVNSAALIEQICTLKAQVNKQQKLLNKQAKLFKILNDNLQP